MRCFPVFTILLSLYVLPGCQSDEHSNNTNVRTNTEHDHNKHSHSLLNVEHFGENTLFPAATLNIEQDSVSGWNLHIKTENFTFTPQQVNNTAQMGEGHAHLYIDNYKMARIYSNWYHIKNLTPGKHEVRVTLNANDHSTWANRDQAISASAIIIQE